MSVSGQHASSTAKGCAVKVICARRCRGRIGRLRRGGRGLFGSGANPETRRDEAGVRGLRSAETMRGAGRFTAFADDSETPIAHGVKELPCGEAGERFKIASAGFRVRGGEDQVIGLQANDFLEVHLRPVLRGVHNAGGVGPAKRVGDECVFADGDEGVSPDDEEDAAGRQGFELCVKRGEASLEIGGERFARFRDAQQIGQFLRGGENFIDVASVGCVGGDAESIEGTDGVEAIDFLGDENEIRVERGDFTRDSD